MGWALEAYSSQIYIVPTWQQNFGIISIKQHFASIFTQVIYAFICCICWIQDNCMIHVVRFTSNVFFRNSDCAGIFL